MFAPKNTPKVPSLGHPDLNLKLICKDCKDPVPNIIEDYSAGDLVCGNCGLVLGNRIIDERSEWRTFSNSDENTDDPSRVGAVADPLLGAINQIESTMIGQRDGGTGRSRDLNKAHSKSVGQRAEEALIDKFRTIQTMCERISLPKIVIDSSKQLYKRVEDEKLLKGKSSDAIIAACIYIACREHQVTRTFKEICALSKVKVKEIAKCFKLLGPIFEKPAERISHDSYISRFASILALKPEVVRATKTVASRAKERGTLAGKSPISLVAACIYIVCSLSDDPRQPRDIAEVAGCTEATLRNAYRHLYQDRVELCKDIQLAKSVDELTV